MSNKPQFGIIGFGRFGKLWAQAIEPFGEVKIFDKKNKKNSLLDTINCDLLFLLVPISEIESICKKIAPHLKPNTIVIDACSVKTHPVKMMKKWLPPKQPIIATHPLFGPDSIQKNGLAKQKIVISTIRASNKELENFESLLKKLHLEILRTTPREHDKQMAKSQALVHLLGRALAKLHLKPQEISTPDYQTLIQINNMVNNDTWELFYDMQRKNPYTKNIRKALIAALQKLGNTIQEGPAKSKPTIAHLRKKINTLDKEIIETISKRLAIVEEIGALKKQQQLKIKDSTREQKLHNLHETLAKKRNIDPKTIHHIFTLLMKESRRAQL